MNEPCARVNHQQTAVRILYDVRGMKVGIDGSQKIGILGMEGSPVPGQYVPLHAVRIKLCAEEIALVLRAETGAAITQQAGRRDARLAFGGKL